MTILVRGSVVATGQFANISVPATGGAWTANPQAGDLLVCYIYNDDGTTGFGTIIPAGFTLLDGYFGTNGNDISYTAYKYWSAGDTTYATQNSDNNGTCVLIVVALSGAAASSPIDAHGYTAYDYTSPASLVAPSQTSPGSLTTDYALIFMGDNLALVAASVATTPAIATPSLTTAIATGGVSPTGNTHSGTRASAFGIQLASASSGTFTSAVTNGGPDAFASTILVKAAAAIATSPHRIGWGIILN